MNHNRIILFLIVYTFSITIVKSQVNDSLYKNWYFLDYASDDILGISFNKAKALLQNKKSQPVVIGIIDSGVDLDHKDIKNNLWTNPKEIPNNGIDDDKNGFIDDIHGWNFLDYVNNPKCYESYEITRIYRKYYNEKGDTIHKDTSKLNKTEIAQIKQIKEKYFSEKNKYIAIYRKMQSIKKSINKDDSIIKVLLKKEHYKLDDVKQITVSNPVSTKAKFNMIRFLSNPEYEKFFEYYEHVNLTLNYFLNYNYYTKRISDINNLSTNTKYGNSNIRDFQGHGTTIAGAAIALKNNSGIIGICENVKLMIISAVPYGGEHDKDIAMAIKYATDNGANIINLSFGKRNSPNKDLVFQELLNAEKKGVLIIHGSGNENENLDTITYYPNKKHENINKTINNWLEVGSTGMNKKFLLKSSFSNYSHTNVDIFAPGEYIYTTFINNQYGITEGTSLSCAIVASAAALLKSYYPNLTAIEIKRILMESVTINSDLITIQPNNPKEFPKQIPFNELSVSGGILNIYQALLIAEKVNEKK